MNTLIIFSFFVAAAVAHPAFQLRIPNGQQVPDPCNDGQIWLAVGHYDPDHHTLQKNPFALAFRTNGLQWNATLCQQDSDGDGKTNGEELGDPNCIWTVGATPEQAASGHPGLCNPRGSCADETFYCGCHGNNCIHK
ncbi:hypothetical protein ACF0H5_007726 [Mactra antiquata]